MNSSSSSFSSSNPSKAPNGTSSTRSENPAAAPNRIDASATCDMCGRTGAAEFGDRKLCVDCYQGCGSCCSESESNINADA